MATTRTLVLCDALATALNTAWAPTGNDGTERCYFKRIGDADSETGVKLVGRKVFIFPTEYDRATENRAEKGYTHRVSVLTVERFTDAGDPTTSWTDERVDFVTTRIVQGFDFSRDPPSWNEYLTTLAARVQLCDAEKLSGQGKLFYSLCELEFSEHVTE